MRATAVRFLNSRQLVITKSKRRLEMDMVPEKVFTLRQKDNGYAGCFCGEKSFIFVFVFKDHAEYVASNTNDFRTSRIMYGTPTDISPVINNGLYQMGLQLGRGYTSIISDESAKTYIPKKININYMRCVVREEPLTGIIAMPFNSGVGIDFIVDFSCENGGMMEMDSMLIEPVNDVRLFKLKCGM